MFLVTALRQDLHLATEEITMARIADRNASPYYEYDWSGPVCAVMEQPYTFAWSEPVCAMAAGPYRFAWSEPVCALRYTYSLEWQEMDE